MLFPKGRRHIEESLPGILEDLDNKLSGALRVLLTELRLEMQCLHRQIEEHDKRILCIAGELEPCRRLVAIPGIRPITATAMIAAIGNGAAFRGRIHSRRPILSSSFFACKTAADHKSGLPTARLEPRSRVEPVVV